jgi:hypothetical protein
MSSISPDTGFRDPQEEPTPEKTPLVEPTPLSVASAKNSRAVTNSGKRPVAHKLMHRNVMPPA